MDEMTRTKTGPTLIRYRRAMLDKAFDIIRGTPILETHSTQRGKQMQSSAHRIRSTHTCWRMCNIGQIPPFAEKHASKVENIRGGII